MSNPMSVPSAKQAASVSSAGQYKAFRVGECIGAGGCGEVFECFNQEVPGSLAVKRLFPGADEEATRRFLREMRILAKLKHKNIIRIHAQILDVERPSFVMPRYKASLEIYLHQLVGDLSKIRKVFGAILDGIEYAHAKGVIHRDLKPSNILMNGPSDVVITDFGLGREFSAESTRQTVTGFGLGTFLYMPPEQISNAKYADQRSDIYSLGRILFEMFTGELPLGQLDLSKVPSSVGYVIRKCTQQEADKRYQSICELRTDFTNLLEEEEFEGGREQLALSVASVTESTPREKLQEILNLISRYHDEDSLLHQFVMEAPIVDFLRSGEQTAAADLALCRFANHIADKGWSFEYTDNIAERCKALYKVVDDPTTRATLLWSIAVLGVNHNRWHVMEIFGELIAEDRCNEEVTALVDLFESKSLHFSVLSNYVELKKLDGRLRPFFKPAN